MKRVPTIFAWAIGLMLVVAKGAAGDATSDPFAPNAHGGFSTKNPNFARYAAAETRGFDRTGPLVTVEIVCRRGERVAPELWPAEPESEWLRDEAPRRIALPVNLFHATSADHLEAIERDPDGNMLPEPVKIGVFAGVYIEPSEEVDGGYWVELFFNRSEFEGWVRHDASFSPILSNQQVVTRLVASNRWMIFGMGGGASEQDDGVKTRTEVVLYLRVADGLPPVKHGAPWQEPTKITPPAR